MARILVIEDNAANLDLMEYLLAAFGHTTSAVRDGEKGLQAAASERPDLIICDVHMPKLDGYQLVRKLKANPSLQLIPVIAVTALAMVDDRDRILRAGFDDYLAKPIDPEVFAQQIQRFLGDRGGAILAVDPEKLPAEIEESLNKGGRCGQNTGRR